MHTFGATSEGFNVLQVPVDEVLLIHHGRVVDHRISLAKQGFVNNATVFIVPWGKKNLLRPVGYVYTYII